VILDDDDPDALLTLLYVSTCRDASPEALARIGRASRRNNARDGVSGLLLCDGRQYGQLTEGPPKAMRALKERIYADPGHDDIATLLFAQTGTARRFADWQMGYLALDASKGQLAALRAMRGVAALEALDALVPSQKGWQGDRWPE
jgi:hypothetical protein